MLSTFFSRNLQERWQTGSLFGKAEGALLSINLTA